MLNSHPASQNLSIYEQVADRIREEIVRGILTEGDRLPSTRQLAATLGVSRLTVHKAYQMLADEGIVIGQLGSGTFVAPLRHRETSRKFLSSFTEKGPLPDFEEVCRRSQILSFATHVPDLQLIDLSEFYAEQLRISQADSWNAFLPCWEGEPRLRDLFVRLFGLVGHVTERDRVLVRSWTSPSDTFLKYSTEPGDQILMDEPSFLLRSHYLKAFGLSAVGFYSPRDSADHLAEMLERESIRAVMISPYFGSGVGVCWEREQIRVLAEYCRRYDVPVFMGVSFGLLSFAELPQILSDFDGVEVWAALACPTILSPAISACALSVPASMVEEVSGAYIGNESMSQIGQLALASYLTSSLKDHLNKSRKEYLDRGVMLYQALRSALGVEFRVIRPTGGYGLVVEMPKAVDSAELFRAGLEANVAFMPGAFLCAESRNYDLVRFSFGSVRMNEIERGAERSARVLRRAVGLN